MGTSTKVGPWQTISLVNDHGRATFSAHTCSPDCVAEFPFSEVKTPASPPLQTPILHCGWTRTRVKHSQGGRRRITYTAPCGRKMRDLSEVSNMAQTTFEMSLNVWQVHKYLLLTGQKLEMDMFNFDWWVQVKRTLSC